jgi:hypothetical protein
LGTDQQAIADQIYATKAAGVQTAGNVSTSVLTPTNGSVIVKYQAPQSLYIWVKCTITTSAGFAGAQAVVNSILAYGATLGVGDNVLIYRVNSAPSSIAGVLSVSSEITFTQSPTDSPVYSATDIAVTQSQISSWDNSRISIVLA